MLGKKHVCLVRWISPSLNLRCGEPFSHLEFGRLGWLLDLGFLLNFHLHPQAKYNSKWEKCQKVLIVVIFCSFNLLIVLQLTMTVYNF